MAYVWIQGLDADRGDQDVRDVVLLELGDVDHVLVVANVQPRYDLARLPLRSYMQCDV